MFKFKIHKYGCIPESCIDEILPLADEYEVKCALQKCENWLLMELEFKEGKVSPHYQGVDSNVRYLMKCLYYGEKYSLMKLYKMCFTKALPYKLHRYKENKHYQMLSENNKRDLLESRLSEIENKVYWVGFGHVNSNEDYRCPMSLFL